MVCGDVHRCRQLLVLCGVCMYSYGCGLVLAFPSVLNRDLLSSNATIKASPDEVSWIAACHGLSGFLGVAIFSPIFQKVGRKTVNIGINVLVMVGWVIFYFANSVAILMWARLVQGLAIGGVFIIAIALSECSLPSNRGFFITLKKVSLAFGSLTCHSLGLVWNWRHFAAFSTLVQFATILVIFAGPESPAYFAITGRFDECRKSFRWLFGHATDTEKDLRNIISAQMKNREQKKREKTCQQINRTAKILLKKDFLKPFFIAALSLLALDACGRYFMLAYITQIMIEITGDNSVSMYCSIAGDCLLVFALSLSCYMIKKFTRRTLIFRLGFLSVFLMFLVSFTIVIRSYSIISGMAWLTPSVVLLHSFVAHIGLVPVTYAIIFEIFPLEYKGLASFSTGIVFTVVYSLTLKLTPLMITHTGIEGTYAIYGSCVLVCLGILFFMLPETKDRTLQDIEDEIRGMNRNVNDVQCILINENCSK